MSAVTARCSEGASAADLDPVAVAETLREVALLRAELIQVAAVAAAWVEADDRASAERSDPVTVPEGRPSTCCRYEPDPDSDDRERMTCKRAGQPGHNSCGTRPCGCPRFIACPSDDASGRTGGAA